jgi:hypothetical protein
MESLSSDRIPVTSSSTGLPVVRPSGFPHKFPGLSNLPDPIFFAINPPDKRRHVPPKFTIYWLKRKASPQQIIFTEGAISAAKAVYFEKIARRKSSN